MAAATVVAGVAMIRSGLQTVDAQAKMAQSLGTTVESLQVLDRAADLSGVSMGNVEQATVQLTRRLSQAAAGAGPAVEALDRLGLSVSALQSLPLDQRIALIQDRLAEFVPEAERAAVASQLFGDRAALVFTRIDTATLRQATADVTDFGIVVSEQDADQIERTNDALSRLGSNLARVCQTSWRWQRPRPLRRWPTHWRRCPKPRDRWAKRLRVFSTIWDGLALMRRPLPPSLPGAGLQQWP
ncbi:hypothetical protein RNZ50_26890 [Paracoccaceae bacterium Fryx2]|nr:hypothetical protein [Paracoccaceae bacterium Fryx2]